MKTNKSCLNTFYKERCRVREALEEDGILLQELENLVYNNDHRTILGSSKIIIVRMIVLDKRRSIDIREQCGIHDVVRRVRVRRREWRYHVKRMPNSRLTRIAMKNELNSKRSVGRPPKRWHESWTSGSQQSPSDS
jgi:hypothetical protein